MEIRIRGKISRFFLETDFSEKSLLEHYEEIEKETGIDCSGFYLRDEPTADERILRVLSDGQQKLCIVVKRGE